MISKPIKEFEWVIENTTGPNSLEAEGDLYSLQPKFMLHSGHDWTVAQPQIFMNTTFFMPTTSTFTDEVVPYASTWNMELHSTKTCGSEPVVGTECYWIEVWWNGVIQTFSECANPEKCTWGEFRDTVLPARGFIETSDDYKTECLITTEGEQSIFSVEKAMQELQKNQ